MQSVLRSNIVGPGLAALTLVAVGTALEPSRAGAAGASSGPLLSTQAPHGPAPGGAPLELIPDRALVKVAIDDPAGFLDRLAGQPAVTALAALPGNSVQALGRVRAALAEAESELGLPPLALARDLGGAGGVFWLDLKNLKPDYGLVLRGSDNGASRAALEVLLARAAERAGFPGAFDAPTAHRVGVDLWELGDDAAVGWRDGMAMLAKDSDAVLATLGGAAARQRERSRGHWTPAGPTGALGAQFDLERARLLAEFGDDDGLRDLVRLPDKPEGQLIFGPSLSTIARGDVLDAWLTADPNGVELGLASTGPDVVPPTSIDLAIEPGPTDLLFATLHREPGVLVDGTLELDDEASASLAKGLSQFELLMGGLDLRRDVLPRLGPTVQLIAREIPFRSGPAPELRLPALALVMELNDSDLVREPLVAAFQNAIVLSNVDRAQKGEGRPFLLRRAEVDETHALTAAHYSRPAPGEPIDMVYNAAPACAATAKWLILASHEDLLNDLMDELPTARDNRAQPVADRIGPSIERLVVDGSRAAALIEAQRDAIELAISLRRGLSEARARELVDGVLALLAAQSHLSLELSATGPDGLALVVRLDSGGTAE
ncbi:hypothetical protein [Engelhardtia mirabilis]|uniref:DUF3352 domain-containing protein n=1 Tax=Engelhardtia mirabilis TaxID=2528011 RepID=A0A518BFW3_9BACT|nr:hypothetical protein Pla133_08690 [Planctomycetes bacterium Pla133]QDV00129.1 hypothetical protein Pla86_08680 [Planctomycetes bacterium Pla86]